MYYNFLSSNGIRKFIYWNIVFGLSASLNYLLVYVFSQKLSKFDFAEYVFALSIITILSYGSYILKIYFLKIFKSKNKKGIILKFYLKIEEYFSFILINFIFFFIIFLLLSSFLDSLNSKLVLFFFLIIPSIFSYLFFLQKSYLLSINDIYTLCKFQALFVLTKFVLSILFYLLLNTIWSIFFGYLISYLIIAIYFKKKILNKFFFSIKSKYKSSFNSIISIIKLNKIILIKNFCNFFIFTILIYIDIFYVYLVDLNNFNLNYIATSIIPKTLIFLFNPLNDLILTSLLNYYSKKNLFFYFFIICTFGILLSLFFLNTSEIFLCNHFLAIKNCQTDTYEELIFSIPLILVMQYFYFLNLYFNKNKITIYELFIFIILLVIIILTLNLVFQLKISLSVSYKFLLLMTSLYFFFSFWFQQNRQKFNEN